MGGGGDVWTVTEGTTFHMLAIGFKSSQCGIIKTIKICVCVSSSVLHVSQDRHVVPAELTEEFLLRTAQGPSVTPQFLSYHTSYHLNKVTPFSKTLHTRLVKCRNYVCVCKQHNARTDDWQVNVCWTLARSDSLHKIASFVKGQNWWRECLLHESRDQRHRELFFETYPKVGIRGTSVIFHRQTGNYIKCTD